MFLCCGSIILYGVTLYHINHYTFYHFSLFACGPIELFSLLLDIETNDQNQSKKEEVLAQEKCPDIPDCFNIFCASIIDLGMGKSLFRIREPGYTDESYEDIL